MKSVVTALAMHLLVIALAAAPGCHRHSEEAAATEGPGGPEGSGAMGMDSPGWTVHVTARAIEKRSFEEVVTAPGQWRSSGEIVVNAPFAGAVDSLSLQPGDRVHRGQMLCRILTRESQAALRGAEIMAAQARDEAGRKEAARALELARREMVRVPIVAPRDGIVSAVPVQSGSEIAESGEILAIQSPNAVVFEARVDPSDAPRVHDGQSATIVDHGQEGKSRNAAVQRILPVAGASDQATLVWLTPQHSASDSSPAIDRFGTARITTGATRRSPAVPDSAVVQDDLTGETRIALIDARGRAIWTRVTLGAGASGWHELKAPELSPGALVITQGHRGLPDSTRVEPAPSRNPR